MIGKSMRLDRFLANSGVGTRKEVKDILKKRKIKCYNVRRERSRK